MRVFVFRPQPEAERTARASPITASSPWSRRSSRWSGCPEWCRRGNFDAIVLTSGNAVPVLAEGPAAWRDLPGLHGRCAHGSQGARSRAR